MTMELLPESPGVTFNMNDLQIWDVASPESQCVDSSRDEPKLSTKIIAPEVAHIKCGNITIESSDDHPGLCLGTKVFIDGVEQKGVRRILIGDMTRYKALTVTLEMIAR